MKQYIDKNKIMAEIEKRKRINVLTNEGAFEEDIDILYFLNTLESVDPYEQCVQYDSIKASIQTHAETYSFNIESELFNQEDEQLNVRVEVKKTRNNIKIIIEDNGIGMDKNTLERITEIFYTTKASGNGLGVVLSKEIIEMHNGTINYKSTLGKGTTVTITLPNK